MRRFIILMAIVLPVLSSCSIMKFYSVEEEYNKAWVGKTYSEIVRHFGAPDRVEFDGKDGSILVYEDFTTTTSTDVDTHFGYFDPDYETKVTRNKHYTHFFIDVDSRCYLVKSNRVEMDEKSKSNLLKALVGTWGAGLLIPLAFGISMSI